MAYADPTLILDVLGWLLFTTAPLAAAVVAVIAWRRPNRVITTTAAALLAVALLVAALLPAPAPVPVSAITTVAALVAAVAGGGPVVRALLDRTAFEEEGVHGGIVVGEREVLRGGAVIGLLERLAVAGSVVAGVPEALAVIIAIKGVGRFTELENGAVRERFIVGTLASWIWAAAAAGLVLLTRG